MGCCGAPESLQDWWRERFALINGVVRRRFQAMWVPAGTVVVWWFVRQGDVWASASRFERLEVRVTSGQLEDEPPGMSDDEGRNAQ